MNTVYMQLQNTARNTLLKGYGNVVFNQVLTTSGQNDITYDTITGIMTINRTGAYYLDWFLVSQQSSNPVTVLLEIGDEGGKTIPANTSLTHDEVTGSAAIMVNEAGTQIVLTNSEADVIYGDVPVVANLVIHSIEIDEVLTPEPSTKCGGSIVNFQNGVVDCPICNPFSWPVLLEVLQISWFSNQVDYLKNVFTPSGLEELLGLNAGTLNDTEVQSQIGPILNIINMVLGEIAAPLSGLSGFFANSGLVSTDAYINHADVEVVPAIFGADIPIFSLDASAMVPQIIAQDGIITSFAAEYDSVVSFDISILGTIPGFITTLNNLLGVLAGTVATLVSALGSLGSIIAGYGAPLPSEFADTLGKLIMAQLKADTLDSNHHVHAVLWKRTDNDDLDINWEKVSDLDLGPVPWLELAPVDTFVASIGDIIAAGGNILSTILSFFQNRGTVNQVPTNTPFRAALDKNIRHPISAGDYLIVQFTLVGGDNTTILAGVIATNLMASVGIDCE